MFACKYGLAEMSRAGECLEAGAWSGGWRIGLGRRSLKSDSQGGITDVSHLTDGSMEAMFPELRMSGKTGTKGMYV